MGEPEMVETPNLTLTTIIGTIRSLQARHEEALDAPRSPGLAYAGREHHRGAAQALGGLLAWLEGFQPARGRLVVERGQPMALDTAKRVTLLAHVEVAHCEGPFLPKALLAGKIADDLLLTEVLEPKSRRADGAPVAPWSSYWVERVRISAPNMDAVLRQEED